MRSFCNTYATGTFPVIARVFALALAYLAAMSTAWAADSTCHGKFPDPISDICWSCAFPLTVGSVTVQSMDQEDTANTTSAVCACSNPPKAGLSTGFWEPVRQVDVTRVPWCMVSLGGLKMDPGFDAPEGAIGSHDDTTRHSFYQVHWYTNPLMYWLEVLLDNSCLERGQFDLAYATEIDPLWNDDELSLIVNPDAVLFANPVAQASCAADCVAATAGFPLSSLFWCGGCQGSLYPLNGHVQAHIGGVQASSLLVERMTAKMHREGLIWGAWGDAGLCGYYPLPLLDKSYYKYQMTYPVAQTEKINGKCCQPFGRSTIVWGAGKEFPYVGEDFSYLVYRKRNCCSSALNLILP